VLQPVRRIIPPAGGLDWSFLIVIIVVGYVMRAIPQFAYDSAYCLIR